MIVPFRIASFRVIISILFLMTPVSISFSMLKIYSFHSFFLCEPRENIFLTTRIFSLDDPKEQRRRYFVQIDMGY